MYGRGRYITKMEAPAFSKEIKPFRSVSFEMRSETEFICGGVELIDSIREMWHQLNLHASKRSPFFSDQFSERTFQLRKEEMVSKAKTCRLRIEIARDATASRDLGYCASSIDYFGNGEIESLFVDDEARRRGVGDALMRRTMEWMRQQGARSTVVFTVYGDESIFSFYARYGFRPKMVMLESSLDQAHTEQP
jgi:GNAT superfamily N-acetyltransferase